MDAGVSRRPGVARREFVRQTALGLAAGALGPVLCPPRLRSRDDDLSLGNDAIAVTWSAAGGALRAIRLDDRRGGRTLDLPPDVFTLTLDDGSIIRASDLRTDAPHSESLDPYPRAARRAEQLPGRAIRATLSDPAGRLRVHWRAMLRDGSDYVRWELTLEALGADLAVREVTLIEIALSGASVAGTVAGSPIVAGNLFLAVEHPLATAAVTAGRARAALPLHLPLRPGVPLTVSAVIGTTTPGQLRRGVLQYLERERAHPYRPFLHYNSWYDLGYFTKYDAAQALAVITAFGEELTVKRGVTLDSFLFDDGWDDTSHLWHFHSGFPHGFAPLKGAAARYGAAPGVWLSPWGGYGHPREERLAAARAAGYETDNEGLALSGPKYYELVRHVCRDFLRKGGVNHFKLDGTGSAATAFPRSPFGSDFEAAIRLIAELRARRPDLYVNLTTGTYPSPFWLLHADSIWRGGDDHDFAGVGSDRQRWITYRDADTYAGIVKQGPLFPLNSLMLHGLIYAQHARNLSTDPQNDFRSEVRAYFGSGTQLQEMYVTASLLTPANWDDLAEAARWARDRAAILVDSHWVGGDPMQLEPYGHAAWAPEGGVLCLRNPRDVPQTLELDVGTALELPDGTARNFTARSPWAEDRGKGLSVRLAAGTSQPFALQPFEVLTLDLDPLA